MPRFDFRCPNGHIRPDVWVSTFRDGLGGPTVVCPCGVCGQMMEKVPAAPNFTVTGFNAKNGYSK